MTFYLVQQAANERITDIHRVKAEINLAALARETAVSQTPPSKRRLLLWFKRLAQDIPAVKGRRRILLTDNG